VPGRRVLRVVNRWRRARVRYFNVRVALVVGDPGAVGGAVLLQRDDDQVPHRRALHVPFRNGVGRRGRVLDMRNADRCRRRSALQRVELQRNREPLVTVHDAAPGGDCGSDCGERREFLHLAAMREPLPTSGESDVRFEERTHEPGSPCSRSGPTARTVVADPVRKNLMPALCVVVRAGRERAECKIRCQQRGCDAGPVSRRRRGDPVELHDVELHRTAQCGHREMDSGYTRRRVRQDEHSAHKVRAIGDAGDRRRPRAVDVVGDRAGDGRVLNDSVEPDPRGERDEAVPA
jgi:hypothetical protein